jgi:hypothetical protein
VLLTSRDFSRFQGYFNRTCGVFESKCQDSTKNGFFSVMSPNKFVFV